MGKSFIKIDRNIVMIADFDFAQIGRVVHRNDFFQFLLLQSFAVRQRSFQDGALQIGLSRLSTGSFHQVRKTIIFFRDHISTGKLYFAVHFDMFLLDITGRGAHINFIEGLKGETGVAIDHKTIFHAETKELCHFIS